MADPLIASMNEAITVRGPGSGGALCASLGLAKNSYKNWRYKGEIPQRHRDGVQAWIDAPWKPKPAPEIAPRKAKSAAAKPAIKIPPAEPMPPIKRAIDHSAVLQALGLTITTAWLPEGETMRQVRVAVLP